MRNIFKIVIVIAAIGFFTSSAAYAAYGMASDSMAQQTSAMVDAGNQICPVSGDKVDGKNFYEYNGKRYGLCCPMCAATFKGDPTKYSAIADKEVAGK